MPRTPPIPFLGLILQRRGVRFLLVGAWNTVFGYLIFLLLVEISSRIFSVYQLAYMAALVLANALAILNAFCFHKYITFKSRTRGLAVLAELLRFSSTYVFTFLLSLFLLPVFIEFLHVSTPVAGALVLLVCMVVSYLGHAKFSFRNIAS